jgi:tetratricopeptide (TPR) repeat protein/SAM-dependent methyltransferase
MSKADVRQNLQTAFLLHQRGELDKAANIYRQILKKAPDNYQALHYLGVVEATFGNFEQAKRLLARSLNVQPTNIHFVENYATILCQSEDYESALEVCEQGLRFNHTNVSLLYVSAVALSRLKQLQDSIAHFDRLLLLQPNHIVALNERGSALAEIENYDAALASIQKALTFAPQYAEAHLNSGNLYGILKRYDEAIAAYDTALALKPELADAWVGRGNVSRQLKRYDDALSAYDKALALKSDSAAAWLGRGNVFSELKQFDNAFSAYDLALGQKPDLVEAWLGRGNAYLALGRPDLATDAALRALDLREMTQTKELFVQSLKFVEVTADHGRFRNLALRALSEAWGRPRELMNFCIGLLKLDEVVSECIARADSTWPERIPAAELIGSSLLAVLSHDQLLCRMLECAPATDVGLERLLISVRHAVLMTSARDEALDESLLAFFCALARHCFVNDYVFSTTDVEAEQAQRLRALLEKALAAGEPCSALLPVVVGAYFPLHSLVSAEASLNRSWPECVNALLVQQVREPAEECRIALTIPALTGIDNEVSRAVRLQYEESPYPRWTKAGPPTLPLVLKDRRPAEVLDVLIAGCGTGLSTIEFARQWPQTRNLAIDLSVASLSYAKRMAQSMGVTNIEFAHADIMRLASIDREFDFIDASGVLHHLADPWEGWRVLLSLLRPGGAMQVGLYSKLARLNIVTARALIAERGYQPTPADIRRCREEIMETEKWSLLRSVSSWGDFYTTNECRDLLFHVQEHRVTIPEIKSFLAANNLQFAGFILEPPIQHRFAMRFSDPAAMTDLACWHAFEIDNPQTFTSMYGFGVLKPA